MSRVVTLVLVDGAGAPLGALPPFRTDRPWWQEIGSVVDGARSAYGVRVDVLRLLHAAGDRVTYLAQLTAGDPPAALVPAGVDPAPHPRRAAYAEPGGPAASVRWAVDTLDALGSPGAVAVPDRTWNLSAVWRLDAGGVPVAWLKQVPAFFAHEPRMISLVSGIAPGLVPPLLATGTPGRMLLAHVPGADPWGAGADMCARIAPRWVPVQIELAGRVDEITALGAPDARLSAEPFARVAADHDDDVDGLRELIGDLPRRLAEIAACGMPDTLVHGDLHLGNSRVDGAGVVILDWGDATAGPAAYDILRLTSALEPAAAAPVVAAWARSWRAAFPDADPERAVRLTAPVALLRRAVVYAGFLAAIEPSEWPYHERDIPDALRAAVAAYRGEHG